MGARRGPRKPAAAAHEVEILRLAAGGEGVGRIGGKVVFVPLAAPGDLAEVALAEEHRAWSRGRLLRLLRPSPRRVAPRCPHFGACGGCQWQHLEYAAQLEAKRAIVADALARIGRLPAPQVPAAVPSPREYGYRHRVRLQVGPAGAAPAIGYFRAGTHEVVPLVRCPVLHPALERLLAILAAAAAAHAPFLGRCREIHAAADYAGLAVRVGFRGEGGPLPAPRTLADALVAAGEREGLRVSAGGPPVARALGPEPDALVADGEGFTQVNLAQNPTLVRTVLELADPSPGAQVLDLFCGIGNLSLPAAGRGAAVLGVDQDPGAVRLARENARRLGRAEAEFLRAPAVEAARDLGREGRRFDLVLLNPPRTGARDTAALLPRLGPRHIVMVSCDAATFARDAAVLAQAGYRLDAVAPLDLFPQTSHVETVARFTAAPAAPPGERPSRGGGRRARSPRPRSG